jgi:hypothetical protein
MDRRRRAAARRCSGARAERVPVESRVLLLAHRCRGKPRAAGTRVPDRRDGRREEPQPRLRRAHRALQRHRHGEDGPVVYTGILPDLFKEGKGVVAQGKIGPDGVFHATEVLAKHDENYMPPEAAAAVDKAKAREAMEHAAKTLQP